MTTLPVLAAIHALPASLSPPPGVRLIEYQDRGVIEPAGATVAEAPEVAGDADPAALACGIEIGFYRMTGRIGLQPELRPGAWVDTYA